MENNSIGKIIGVSDLNIKVLLSCNKIKIKDVLYYEDDEKTIHRFEVTEIDEDIAYAVPFESAQGVRKGIELSLLERRITN
jgi:hypothetical protein